MEIRQLRYFVAMAETGSLMKASERLHIAQPALSVHLSNLEGELGVKLVERSARGVTMTEAGQLLYERATEMLRYYNDSIAVLKKQARRPAGLVSLGLPSTLPEIIAPSLYRAIRRDLPEVNLYVVDASTAALYEWLQRGKIDFAILFSVPENVGLKVTPLYVEDFCLVGVPDPNDKGLEIDFDEIFNFELIMPCTASPWRKILETVAEQRGKSFNSPLETESVSALRSVAASGQCHTILPRTCVHRQILEGTLQARRIVNPQLRGLKSIVSLENKVMTSAQHEIHNLIVNVVQTVTSQMNLDIRDIFSPEIARVSPSSQFSRPAPPRETKAKMSRPQVAQSS